MGGIRFQTVATLLRTGFRNAARDRDLAHRAALIFDFPFRPGFVCAQYIIGPLVARAIMHAYELFMISRAGHGLTELFRPGVNHSKGLTGGSRCQEEQKNNAKEKTKIKNKKGRMTIHAEIVNLEGETRRDG